MGAFKEFIKQNEHRVAKTVIGMLGACPEAEDVGQETFIRFFKSLDKFRGDSSVSTYLTRIAINLSLNELKKRKRLDKYFFKKSGSGEDKTLENLPAGPLESREREAKDMVGKAVAQLKPEFRAVIVLRLIDGYTSAETAKILNLPLGTVLSRLARGQMKLKEILKQSIGGVACL